MEAQIAHLYKDTGFEDQLYLLGLSWGFDFAAYNRSIVLPQVLMRMKANSVESMDQYMDHLVTRPDEFALLFEAILIHVTAFFRDPEAWDTLSKQAVPGIIVDKQAGEPIRVWSAGCSSGEEVYSIAIVLAEALGLKDFSKRVRIFATDVDMDALVKSRAAVYSEKALETIPDGLRKKYLVKKDINRYVVRRELRDRVVFARHDLLKDPPFSRLDIISCRNTLMYYNTEAQDRILARFHFALVEHGFLFLGKAETVFNHHDLFRPMNLKHRVFFKLPKAARPAPGTTGFSHANTPNRTIQPNNVEDGIGLSWT